MDKILANHYTETLIYSIYKTYKSVKASLNQFITSIDNITAEQFVVLDIISNAKELLCQQDVATILSKDKSNIKRIVEILEKKGYVKKKIGKKGRRLVNFLIITPKGTKLVEDNIERIRAFMQEFFADITNEEIKTLRNIIQKMEKSTNSFI